jgi:mannose/cellobiose epimerase-like protein (N-acyl-D-glucosamine 2-epimerase family)
MNRREFLQFSGVAGAVVAQGTAWPQAAEAAPPADAGVFDAEGKIAGRAIDELIARYRYDLFEDFLPFMDKYVIDHEYGGFMTDADRAGKLVSTNKRTRYNGRGIWIYAHLYRNLDPSERHLEVAKKTVDFTLRAKPRGADLWPNALTREGKPMDDPGMLIAGKQYRTEGEVYDDLFVAEGLVAYARASGKDKYIRRAIEILLNAEKIYDQPDYAPTAPLVYLGGEEAPTVPGCRLLGVWMMLIRVTSQLLEVSDHPEVKRIADRSIEAILQHHYNADFDLLVEVLNHDFSRPVAPYDQLSYSGHGIETLWMVLAEAVRRKDRALFDQTAQLFKRHLDCAWDEVYAGWFRGCKHVDDNVWILDKALWVQEEALIGLMLIVEHTGAQWAKAWLAKAYPYVIEKFPLAPHGYALWDIYPDRKVTFVEHFTRIENYHHPRHLMLNLEALLRMKEQGGKVSGVFG